MKCLHCDREWMDDGGFEVKCHLWEDNGYFQLCTICAAVYCSDLSEWTVQDIVLFWLRRDGLMDEWAEDVTDREIEYRTVPF